MFFFILLLLFTKFLSNTFHVPLLFLIHHQAFTESSLILLFEFHLLIAVPLSRVFLFLIKAQRLFFPILFVFYLFQFV